PQRGAARRLRAHHRAGLRWRRRLAVHLGLGRRAQPAARGGHDVCPSGRHPDRRYGRGPVDRGRVARPGPREPGRLRDGSARGAGRPGGCAPARGRAAGANAARAHRGRLRRAGREGAARPDRGRVVTTDLTLVVTAHDETTVCGPTMKSADLAVAAARAAGLTVQTVIGLDRATDATTAYFFQSRFDHWERWEYDEGDLGRVRNALLPRTDGRLIAFLDADDLFSEN